MTRTEWKQRKIHLPFNIEYFYGPTEVLSKMIIMAFVLLYLINKIIYPTLTHYADAAVAQELRKIDKVVAERIEYQKEMQDKALSFEEIENLRVATEKAKVELERIAKVTQKTFKPGDRIKIYDMNAPLVRYGDSYRYSIGAIDVITKIDGHKIICQSGLTYSYTEQIEKVRSNREWKDLVDMQIKGELGFVEDININSAP